MRSASASPANSSCAVWRAIRHAASTVSRTAGTVKSVLLAEPLPCPK